MKYLQILCDYLFELFGEGTMHLVNGFKDHIIGFWRTVSSWLVFNEMGSVSGLVSLGLSILAIAIVCLTLLIPTSFSGSRQNNRKDSSVATSSEKLPHGKEEGKQEITTTFLGYVKSFFRSK